MSHDLFQIAVKALVFNPEGKLLILKESDGVWDLPGGRMNYGESFVEALERECKEELGVKCHILSKQPDFIWTGQNRLKEWRINLCFKVELDSDQFVINTENIEHGYFNSEEAKKLNLSPHLNNLREIYD